MALTSRLEVEIDSRDSEQKSKDLRAALVELEASGNLINPSLKKASQGMDGLGKSAKTATASTKEQREELESLLGRLDPLRKKQDELAKSQAKLAEAFKAGDLNEAGYKRFSGIIRDQAVAINSSRGALTGFNTDLGKTGISAKATSAAMRGVPAQITDIVTSLQGGQAPLTVFLQQGGQLKDMFGGVTPAAKALGSVVIGLINPFTTAAAAVGVLGVAAYKGYEQSELYRKALTMTGQAAGKTADDLVALSGALAGGRNFTEANEAVLALANGGRVTGEVFSEVARAATELAVATGKSAGDIADQLSSTKGSVADLAAEYSDKYGAITLTTFEQIRALEQQGDRMGAVKLLSTSLADEMNARNKEMQESTRGLAKAWDDVKSSISEAWNGLKAELSASPEMFKLQHLQLQMQDALKIGDKALIKGLGDQITLAQQAVDVQTQKTEGVSAELQERKLSISDEKKWSEEGQKYRSNQAKMEQDIAAARKLGLGAKASEAEIEKRISDIRDDYAKKEPKERAARAYTEDAGTKMLDQAKQQYAVLQQQSAIIGSQADGTKTLGTEAKKLIELEQMLADIKGKQTLTADQKSILAMADRLLGQQKINAAKEKENDLTKEALANSAKLLAFQENLNSQLDLAKEGLTSQLAGLGLGQEGRKRLQDDLKIRADYQKQLTKLTYDYNKIVNPTSADKDIYDQESAQIKDALAERLTYQEDYYVALDRAQSDWTLGAKAAWQDYVYEAGNIAGQTENLFGDAFHSMEDDLVDFARSGKLTFKSFEDAVIDGLLRIIAKTQIITPLLNTLFGGGAAGGSAGGSMLGGLFGGSGSGGGRSLSFGSMAGLGKNLYSAWNAATGVGSSVASGYASGGVSGALSGGANYYGNMLSGIGNTLSEGFGNLVSTITGTTAAQTAATIGAEGITSAALSGAVSEGASAIGAQFTTGVATTTTATYAAAEAGAAATAASLGGQISAAVSSAAAMWPLAVIMGMYQSGKLYDSGVRPDAGEIRDSAGSTTLGKAVMAPGAAMSGFFEAQDKALSKVVGGKWAAILSGSTLHQAVTKYVGEKLFGTGYQTKDTGLALDVQGGVFDAQTYQDQKKKGGLISGSSKSRTIFGALPADTMDVLGAAYNDTVTKVGGLFSNLGVELSESVLDGLNIPQFKISTKDKTAEEIQAQLDIFFAALGNEAVFAISQATNAGLSGFTFEGLQVFIKNLQDVNGVIKHLNVGLFDMTATGGFMAEQLTAWAGGLDALKTSIAPYYENFFSDTEKATNTLADVTEEFKNLGIVLPESREGYRDMVEGIDKTTEAGRAMFLTLTGLSGDAAAAYTILEQRADSATEATKALATTLAETLNGAVTGAMGAVQRAVTAEKDAATKAYNDRNNALSELVSTATENVSGLTSVGNDLSAALKALRGDSDDAVKMLRAQALATLQSALSTARSGGSLSGFTGLSDALDTVSNNNTDLYGSMEDFARDQGRTANVVAELNTINGKQLTTEEQLLASAQDQIKLAKDQFDDEMLRLDNQLAFAQSQLDALNGIDNSVISVSLAMSGLSAAITAALAAKPAGSAAANTSANNSTLLDAVYQSVLGRETDAAGAAYWGGLLQSGGIDYAGLVAAITKDAKANGELPAHATGGYISGPGTGTSDSILSRLSNGEYVLRADAVRTYGTDLLDQMNAGQLPAFAGGGGIRLVGSGAPSAATESRYSRRSGSAASLVMSGNQQGVIDAITGLQNYLYMITKYSEQTASGIRRQNEMEEAA